ncbi:MAG TPA: class I SAM-dependent methyltransferase, partial [Gammaproteobacteria bacterium]|nr:class I SAM-dependent methyltransferase [Gammaproteobacteria bacterium]
MTQRNLSTAQAKAYYDRLGSKQDWQFYERRAEERLLALGGFDAASAVFELGCGTGALARRLLQDHLPADARYLGFDLSDTMVALARGRVASFAPRARIERSEGGMHFAAGDGSFDRFVSAYVLDLLPPEAIAAALTEAGRLLRPGGLLCLLSLTAGTSFTSRLVAGTWDRLY